MPGIIVYSFCTGFPKAIPDFSGWLIVEAQQEHHDPKLLAFHGFFMGPMREANISSQGLLIGHPETALEHHALVESDVIYPVHYPNWIHFSPPYPINSHHTRHKIL